MRMGVLNVIKKLKKITRRVGISHSSGMNMITHVTAVSVSGIAAAPNVSTTRVDCDDAVHILVVS